jgi:MFS family permease
VELNRIAKINGKSVVITEKLLKEMLPDEQVEQVYGIASLFTGWRLAKNTTLIIICWTNVSLTYFVLLMNSTRMGGNPFLSFAYQSMIELPAYLMGRWLGDVIGRRFTNALSFLGMSVFCVLAVLTARESEYETVLQIAVIIVKFFASVVFFAVNLQSMEIYPTCLRQSGIAVGTIVANILAMFGPYIIFVGTEYDVRYPYMIMGEIDDDKLCNSVKLFFIFFRYTLFDWICCCNVLA